MANFLHKLGPERTEPVQSGRWKRLRSHEKVENSFLDGCCFQCSHLMLLLSVVTFCVCVIELKSGRNCLENVDSLVDQFCGCFGFAVLD